MMAETMHNSVHGAGSVAVVLGACAALCMDGEGGISLVAETVHRAVYGAAGIAWMAEGMHGAGSVALMAETMHNSVQGYCIDG